MALLGALAKAASGAATSDSGNGKGEMRKNIGQSGIFKKILQFREYTKATGGLIEGYNEAENLDDFRRRLKYQKNLDMSALKDRMQAVVGEQTLSVANSGFKYGGSKAKAINDTIYSFKLKQVEYMNQYNLQRRAMQSQEDQIKVGAWSKFTADMIETLSGIKLDPTQKVRSDTVGPLGKTPNLGDSYSRSGEGAMTESVFNRPKKQNYGVKLR